MAVDRPHVAENAASSSGCGISSMGSATNRSRSRAEAADRAVAGMSDDLLAKNEELGGYINVFRVEHRQEHLDELEGALPPH